MAGGPGGDGAGVESKSLFWSVVMSAFAGTYFHFSCCFFELTCLEQSFWWHSLRLGSHFDDLAPQSYDTGTIGGIMVMTDWLQLFGIFDTSGENLGWYLPTPDQSLVVSILSAGTFFGALLAYPMGDYIGRKWGIIASCAVFSLGVGLQLDTRWATFIVGRVIAGLGVGLVSCLIPMYQSECSPKHLRGAIVGLYQLAITIGALLAAIVLNATKSRPDHSSWRIPIAVQFVWAAILVIGMLVLPESPRFLLKKGREAAGKSALGRLLTRPVDSPEVTAEFDEIMAALEADRQLGSGSYADCFRNTDGKNGLRTWTGILLQGWQQLTGINFIFYYGTTFFKSAGIKNPFIITIICDVVNTATTIVGTQLIDRVGRRRLLLIGAAAYGMCQPLNIRAKAMSLAVASNWLWNFGIGYATPYLVNPSTTGVLGVKTADLGVKVFFIWGSTCAGCFIFTYFFVPETKGLSLEQIDLLYPESSVLNSEKYRARILADNETFVQHVKGAAHEVMESGRQRLNPG
ncbi:hypothetical protein C0989_012316 [Termitomyces sp. Mn162]|nr:hypothetical protein C0989_012316 [Termitomyces sp. Mn162]